MELKPNGRVFVSEDDQCYSCKHQTKCPVILGLNDNVFVLNDDRDYFIVNCIFYCKRFGVVK
jgi:hypothetical protein